MTSKSLYLLAFFITSNLDASIPPQIEAYLNKNAQNIRTGLPTNFAAHELITVAQRMADLLIKRYKNNIDPQVKPSDLLQELTTYILFQIFAYSPPSTSANLSQNLFISKLLNSFSGTIIGNTLRVNYKNMTIPLLVSVYPNSISFKISGAPLRLEVEPPVSDPKNCFWFRFDTASSQAVLEWLGTMESACPISSEKQGEFLLSFAEVLARTLEAKHIKLDDQAHILCDKNQLTAKFHTLRIFQNKPNWYVAHGFKPKDKTMDDLMTAEREFLTHLKLSKINEMLMLQENATNPELLTTFKEQEKKFAQSQYASDLFAHFMSWLWDTNCEDYLKVYKLIFKRTPIIKPEFSDVIPELKKELG